MSTDCDDILNAPDPVGTQAETDKTGGIIPYKNPHALIAYYLGVASLIPIAGIFTGVAAIVLGIFGLRARKKAPRIRGAVHAWVGIGLGVLGPASWFMCFYLAVR